MELKITVASKKDAEAVRAYLDVLYPSVNEEQPAPKVAEEQPDPVAEEEPAPDVVKESALKAAAVETRDHVNITDLRRILALKVGKHRQDIIDELRGFGAKNLTNLSEQHYAKMFEFLENLD